MTSQVKPVRWWGRLIRILLAIVIISAGIAGATYLKKTAPQTKKRPPAKWVPVVDVQALTASRHQVVVSAMGTVIPARQVVLKSRVAGQVLSVHPEFTEGGYLNKNDQIIQLDEADYKLILSQKKSELVDRQYALKLEQGRQEVAKREWQLLNGERNKPLSNPDLALRKPHLDKVKADLSAAKAAVEKAELDLKRTRILAPFNAIVRSKMVDIGSQVSSQEPLAEIVGTDRFWVRASIPVDRLDWIQIPQQSGANGSLVKIIYARNHYIDGTVVRLMGDMANEGRMARILIEIKDPLRRQVNTNNDPPLLIGEYVRVEIQGRQLDNVFSIPRTAYRDGNSIWLLNSDKTLSIRSVIPIWRNEESVIIRDGLKEGNQLIISDLPAPVNGMQVRVKSSESPQQQVPGKSKARKG